MDKQTFSHYGWIIISLCVLVVMIALATPLGETMSNSVIDIAKNADKQANDATKSGYEENVKYYQEMMKSESTYVDPGLYEGSDSPQGAFQKATRNWSALTSVAANGPRVLSIKDGIVKTNFAQHTMSNISSQILKGDLVLSKDVSTTDKNAFILCSDLNGVYFKNLSYIGEQSFVNCSSLKWIAFESASLKGIMKNAFVGCKNFTTIYYNGTKSEFSKVNIESQGITKTINVVCSDGTMAVNFTGSTSIRTLFSGENFIPVGGTYTVLLPRRF